MQNKGYVNMNESVFTGYYINEFTSGTKDSDFRLCSYGSYSSIPINPESVNLACSKCLDEAHCEGGYIPHYSKDGVNSNPLYKLYY